MKEVRRELRNLFFHAISSKMDYQMWQKVENQIWNNTHTVVRSSIWDVGDMTWCEIDDAQQLILGRKYPNQ